MIDFLKETARDMVAPGKAIFAIDESTGTCNKRFEQLGIPQTEAVRRNYRELLLTAPGLARFVSALQRPALEEWRGDAAAVAAAQALLIHRVRMHSLTSLGQYSADLESDAVTA